MVIVVVIVVVFSVVAAVAGNIVVNPIMCKMAWLQRNAFK